MTKHQKTRRKLLIFLLCLVTGLSMTAFASAFAAQDGSLETEEISLSPDQLINYNGMTIAGTAEGLSLSGKNLNVASSTFSATAGNRYARLEARFTVTHPSAVSMVRFVLGGNPPLWLMLMNTGSAETSGLSLNANGEYVTATESVPEFSDGSEIVLILDVKSNRLTVNGRTLAFSSMADFKLSAFAEVNIQLSTGNDAEAGILFRSLRLAAAPEDGNDISQWPYFNPETDKETDGIWTEMGATPVNVHGGVGVMTSDAGYKNVIRYNDGYKTKRGFIDVSDFSVTLNAVTENTITTVDFWLTNASGQTLCIRIENMGSGSSYNVYVYDYTQNLPPCLGIVRGVPANKQDRGTYVISYDYSRTKTIKVNGRAIDITTDPAVLADYPQGYRSMGFSSNMAKISFGVQSDVKRHKDEMVVLSHINGIPLYDFVPVLSVDLTAPWTSDGGILLENAGEGLRATLSGEDETGLIYGETGGQTKHDVTDFAVKLRAKSESGFVLNVILSGKSASSGSAVAGVLRLSGAGRNSVSALLLNGNGEAIGEEVSIEISGDIEVRFSESEGAFFVNGTKIEKNVSAAALDFAFSNASLALTAQGTAGDSFTVLEICDTPIAYYEPAPNFEREVDPGHKVSDDFRYDPWNAGEKAVPSVNERGVSVSFTGTWSGSWYDVPLSFTTRHGDAKSNRNFLSAYITAGDLNSGDNGIGVAFASSTADGPVIDDSGSLRIREALIVKISLNGTKVSCMNKDWVGLGGGSVLGSFSDPDKNGFLVEFDTENCILYVNGVEITGNFDSFAFKNNAAYLGVFGSSEGSDPAVTNLLLAGGQPLVKGAQIEMVEFPDVDQIRVEEQLENNQTTADENKNFKDPDLKYTEIYLENVPSPLGAGWIVLIAVGGVLAAGGAGFFGVRLVRSKRRNK